MSVKGNVLSVNDVAKEVAQNINNAGGQTTAREVLNTVNKLAPQAKGLLNQESITLINGNKLRQLLDGTLGDKAFLTSQLPYNKEVLMNFANALRNTVKQNAPEGTRSLFSELSKEITLRNALWNQISNSAAQKSVLGLKDLITITSGGAIGTAVGGVLGGGVPGAALGLLAERAIESPYTRTASAVGISQLRKTLQPIIAKIAPETKSLLIEFLRSK